MGISKQRRIKTNRVGARVMRARQEQGLTRKDLCEKLQHHGILMTTRTLSLLERQKRRVTDIEFLALATALEVTIDYLWDE
ncbi:MAG: helix-turn-helix transcriptional regulator [Clostridia bacterium]|nr:helix-turn-helix transcriptional regulator [Clostridia bacterium]